MAGFPYALPSAFPAKGQPDWDVPLVSNVNDLASRNAVQEAVHGAPLDSFPGSSDDAKLTNAMAYAAAQTRPPAIVLGLRSHSFSGPRDWYNGFRLLGSVGFGAREFASTGPETTVICNGVGDFPSLFKIPSGGVKNIWISGIQFRAASGSIHFHEPVTDLGSGPILNDGTFENLSWVGFASIMQARHLRVRIDKVYINEGTDTQFKLAGSDNYYFQSGGFCSSTKLAASKFYFWFTHMSRSDFGPLYITPEKATGVRIDGGYGDFKFDSTKFDSTGRDLSTACQGAALLITGGRGLVFDKLWFFNNAVNPAGTGRSPVDKGQVYIRGTAADIIFNMPSFSGFAVTTGFTPSGTPAIYAATGVTNVKVMGPIAPAGGNKLLQHQSSGIITKFAADDWTLAVA